MGAQRPLICLLFQVKYRKDYERSKGKVIGIKSVSDDSQMAHSAMATKLQSDRHYKKNYEDTKTKYRFTGKLGTSGNKHSWINTKFWVQNQVYKRHMQDEGLCF